MTQHKFCRPGSFFRQTGKNMIQWGNMKEEGTAFTLKDKLSILFICHGNICRSPMAEFIMKDLTEKAGLSACIHCASAAVSREELGNDVYPPARRTLARHAVPCPPRAARQMTAADYDRFDLLIVMDRGNLRRARAICGGDPAEKIRLLLDYAGRPGQEVADPWYSGDFEEAFRDILAGCRGLLALVAGPAGE